MEMRTRVPATTARTLLVVDDDDADMILFLRGKDRAGLDLEVQRAWNAVEALEMLRLQHVEGRAHEVLVVLDLNMPCMNGIEFLAELRADPALCSTVVIAVSGSDDPKDQQAAYRHHVAAYVVKTEDSTERLIRLIAAWFDAAAIPPA